METEKIGINEIIVSIPSLAIKAEEIVRAFHKRDSTLSKEQLEDTIKNDIGKMVSGLGIKQIRLPGYSESNVTFVANAIYNFIKRVSARQDDLEKLRREPIMTIYYASESNPDKSRPEVEESFLLAYSKLLSEGEKYKGIVEMFKGAVVIPVTYACAGGGLALIQAVYNILGSVTAGAPRSAIVITADTAVYDHERAPNAEFTQGAGATLLWITQKPRLVSVLYGGGTGTFHMPLSDFTKFGNETPMVHGKFSERTYVYTVAKSLEQLEKRADLSMKDIQFFVTHVPFPKQSIYFASFLFAHYLKNYQKALFSEMGKRPELGEYPIKNTGSITALMDSKFRAFNTSGGEVIHENGVITYIDSDPEIESYWNWLKKLRGQKEFDAFVDTLHIKEALLLPSMIGNSYSSSAFVAFASLIKNATALHDGKVKLGVLSFYGSGAIASSIPVELTASKEILERCLYVPSEEPKYIDHVQYSELHPELVKGDAARSITNVDLVEKDRRFLGTQELGTGFHIKKRNNNGTGEYFYCDAIGMAEPLIIRYG